MAVSMKSIFLQSIILNVDDDITFIDHEVNLTTVFGDPPVTPLRVRVNTGQNALEDTKFQPFMNSTVKLHSHQ